MLILDFFYHNHIYFYTIEQALYIGIPVHIHVQSCIKCLTYNYVSIRKVELLIHQ